MKERSAGSFNLGERMTIASMKQQGVGMRAMVRMLGGSVAIVSRELKRNSGPAHALEVFARMRALARQPSTSIH